MFVKELHVAAVAVGFSPLLLESSLVELLQAERAHEVLLVKLLPHRADAPACDVIIGLA